MNSQLRCLFLFLSLKGNNLVRIIPMIDHLIFHSTVVFFISIHSKGDLNDEQKGHAHNTESYNITNKMKAVKRKKKVIGICFT